MFFGAKMIHLYVQNGDAFIWTSDDWFKLRTEHRIVADLIGFPAHFIQQTVVKGLPAVLGKEQVTLLLKKNLAKLVQASELELPPTHAIRDEFLLQEKSAQDARLEKYANDRRKEMSSMIDKIVEGKMKKFGSVDRETVLDDEMEKVKKHFSDKTALVTIPTADPWLKKIEPIAVWNYPISKIDQLKCLVFEDLWERGFYITGGEKFGGDFLVYTGDPVKFHAHYIIFCLDPDKNISVREFISRGRIATSTKKTMVFANILQDAVCYQSYKYVSYKEFL